MTTRPSSSSELSTLAAALERAASTAERAVLLDRMVRIAMYTDPPAAHRLLGQLAELFPSKEDELPFSYYLHRANLASLEYQYDEALPDLQRALAGVDLAGDITERIEVYLDYVGVLINLKRMDEARDYFDRATRLLESYPDDILRARAQVREGFLYVHSFSYAQAIPRFNEADTILSQPGRSLTTKDHYFFTLLHSGLGTLQLHTGSFDKAATSFRRAIRRCEEIGIRSRLAWFQLRLGDALMGSWDFAEAATIYRTIIDSRGYGSFQTVAAAKLHLGMCLYRNTDAPDLERIDDLLGRAESLLEQLPDPDAANFSSLRTFRAQISWDRGDYVGAIRILKDALAILDPDAELTNPLVVGAAVEISRMLSESYAELEDFRTAYEYRLLFNFYEVELRGIEKERQQEMFAARFDAAAWEKERESLQLRASQLQLRALRAQMNPHFLFNALNSIQSFITTNEAVTASRYLAKFAMLMRRSLEYSNREYIRLEDEVQFLREYLEVNCKLRFRDRLSHQVSVSPELEEDVIGVPTMIIQPYVENAIEHGLRSRQEGSVVVAFEPDPTDENGILATITDDGVGREQVARRHAADSTRAQHQSRGTSITQSRLELLSGSEEQRVRIIDLYHEDGAAAGTRVEVRIPVVDVVPRRG